MIVGKSINLASAVLGALGAWAVHKGSFAFEQVSFWDDGIFNNQGYCCQKSSPPTEAARWAIAPHGQFSLANRGTI